MGRVIGRRVLLLGALACAMLVTSSCDGSPEPIETSAAPFATEEEAFAAAEETYRAYVDATNEVDLADPATFEPVYALTTGDANADLRKQFTEMHAAELEVIGQSTVALVEGHTAPADLGSAVLDVCLDVSNVDVRNASGESVIDPARPDVQSMRITVEFDLNDRTGLINDISRRDDGPACDA